MDVTLSIASDDLDDEEVQGLTRDLCTTLNRETDVKGTIAEQEAGSGTRGGEIEIGTIALAFLTSGSAVAMFNVFKAYFDRKSTLSVKLRKSDGTELVLQAENLSLDHIDRTFELANEFLGES